MANTLLTPDIIAAEALATLYDTTVMAGLVHRDYEPEFASKVGQTVTVRKPAVFTAQEFDPATGITIQNATEGSVDVTLNHFADVSFAVTSRELSLDIRDFAAQLLNPALEAINQKIEADLLKVRDDVTAEVGVVAGDNGFALTNPRVTIDAGRVLNQAKVPMAERRAVVGPITQAKWLSDELFQRADARGDTEGLREANLGRRVFGFDPYLASQIVKPAQTSGNSTTEVSLAFHRTAFALVTRPLELPQGAANAAIRAYKGLGLRVVMDYDISKKRDIVSIDCLYGIKTLDAARAVLIKGVDVA